MADVSTKLCAPVVAGTDSSASEKSASTATTGSGNEAHALLTPTTTPGTEGAAQTTYNENKVHSDPHARSVDERHNDLVEDDFLDDPFKMPDELLSEPLDKPPPCPCGDDSCVFNKEAAEKKKHQASEVISKFTEFLEKVDSRISRLESDSTKLRQRLDEISTKDTDNDPGESGDNDDLLPSLTVPDDAWHTLGTDDEKQESEQRTLAEVKIYLHTEKKQFDASPDKKYLLEALRAPQVKQALPSVSGTAEPVADAEFSKIKIHSEPLADLLRSHTVEDVSPFENRWQSRLRTLRPPFRILHRARELMLRQISKLEEAESKDKDTDAAEQVAESSDQPAIPSTVENDTATKDDDATVEEVQSPRAVDSGEDGSERAPAEDAEEDRSKHESKEALEHFRCLIGFIDQYLPRVVNKYKMLRSGQQKSVEFTDLWMIYNTGDLIIAPSRRGIKIEVGDEDWGGVKVYTPQVFRVLGAVGGHLNLARAKPKKGSDAASHDLSKYHNLVIDAYRLDFNGVTFGVVPDKFVVREYEGELPISALEVFPLDNVLEPELPEKLLARCGRFVDFSRISHQFYEGLTVGETREEINSEVIVDLALAVQNRFHEVPSFAWSKPTPAQSVLCEMSGCIDNLCLDASHDLQTAQRSRLIADQNVRLDRAGKIDISVKETIEDVKHLLKEDLILLPGTVPAFALRNRKWVFLDIDEITDVMFEDNGFEQLVLPKGHDGLVLSMVQYHSTPSEDTQAKTKNAKQDRADLVIGKGKGRIILLHGPPGVGKTSTAECVAAYTKRPLFPVTSGDIGYDSSSVEKNLTEFFTLAHRWGCVMLIDEADVFMAKRTKEASDLKRNGLVSIFLRILEYYSGILFLTTNRVGVFDDAFKSRIHLSLYYPALDKDSSKKVWQVNLDRTIKYRPDYKINQTSIIEFGTSNFEALKWNGRQIRNAFQTVVALAEFDANRPEAVDKVPTIDAKKFAPVARASLEFEQYLIKTQSGDEIDRAKREGLRYSTNVDLEIPELVIPKEPVEVQAVDVSKLDFSKLSPDQLAALLKAAASASS